MPTEGRQIVGSGSGMPILMLTAADLFDDKASGFKLGADDYLTKPSLSDRPSGNNPRRSPVQEPLATSSGRDLPVLLG